MTVYEAASQLGGQALLAQLLPKRAEFGGIITNLSREMELAQVKVRRGITVTAALVQSEAPDMRMWLMRHTATASTTIVTIVSRTTASPPWGIPLRTMACGTSFR